MQDEPGAGIGFSRKTSLNSKSGAGMEEVTEPGGRQETQACDNLCRLTAETISGGSVNGVSGYQYAAVKC